MSRERDVTLVTGGARSGKSRFALTESEECGNKVFLATAIAFDDEMKARIESHRTERGDDFETVEAPLDLAGAIRNLPPETDVAIVDCLTVWLCNIMTGDDDSANPDQRIDDLLNALWEPPCRIIVVTNEVGMGIVPANALSRDFRDRAGRLNAAVADLASNVIFMVSGQTLRIKGNE